MTKLEVYQALWAHEQQGPQGPEIAYEQVIPQIKAAGFDGVSDHYTTPARVAQLHAALAGHGLAVEGCIFPQSLDDIARALDLAQRYPVHHLTAQVDLQPRRLADALAFLRPALAMAETAQVPLLIETHRGRLTSDLFFTLDLLDEMPELPLLVDLSHYVVARELSLPLSPQMQAAFAQILRHGRGFHGRIATAEQVQAAPFAPQHAGWLTQFEAWWQEGFAQWQHGSLSFTVELGPPPYAVTDAQGRELSDRWADALALAARARALWAEART